MKFAQSQMLDYLHELVAEYGFVEVSNLFKFLKVCGYNRKQRYHLVRMFSALPNISYYERDNISYYCLFSAKWDNSYLYINYCFPVLLDYFPQVDSHFAAGSFASITMSIDDEDYKIAFVCEETAQLCVQNLRSDPESLYILVVLDSSLVTLFTEENLHCIALLNAKYTIEYFTREEE